MKTIWTKKSENGFPTSAIIVRHADGSYLVMQRDKRKHLGGMWEATAGGSALQGEDPMSVPAESFMRKPGSLLRI